MLCHRAMQAESPYQRGLFITLAAATSFVIFLTTEKCFQSADVRNAITMVQSLKASAEAPTIPAALAARHPGVDLNQVAWSGTLTENCYGFVRVRAAVPGKGAIIEYLFDVNLSGQRLHPANPLAKELMMGLQAPGGE